MILDFPHTCKVVRSTKRKDCMDNVLKDIIYEGPCRYQERNTTQIADSMVIRNPLLFIPGDGHFFEINDEVKIISDKGREISAEVEVVRDIRLSFVSLSRLELKLAK